MKVLHVVPSMEAVGGGPSESVPMTAMAQKAAGIETAIAFYDSGELSQRAREAERAGVRLIRFRGGRAWWNPTAFSLDFFRRFESVAAGYDVVHTHIQWLFPVWWAAHVARKLGKRLVMMPRGCFAPERLAESAWKKRLAGWLDRHYAKNASAVWATSEDEAAATRAYVPDAAVQVFPIGLDVDKYRVSRQEGHTLLYLSRISPIKGLDMLAEAWGRVAGDAAAGRWKLLVVGPDDRGYTEEIKRAFAEKCREGSYEFRAPVFGEEKLALLASASAFVLPTRNENWGIAVAEAMASALPVVCTKGAPWRCLETAKAGWWTDISAAGLEDALRRLVALSREERLAMGANARRWAEENLDWGAIGRRMRESYERTLPLLLTASVDTRGMKGADFSSERREKMYLETLSFYVGEFLGKDPARRIVFAENSGWDLEAFKGRLGAFPEDRVEFISLDPGDFDVSRGKGYNESILMAQAAAKSRFIAAAGAFLKATGRYPIYNIRYFAEKAESFVLGRNGRFYGDIKDHGLYDFLFPRNTAKWNGHAAYTVLFAARVDFFMDELAPLYRDCNDYEGRWIECVWFKALAKYRNMRGCGVSLRFPREPVCGGLQGSSAQTVAFSKDNSSLKSRVMRLVGNAIRRLAPWFWF